MSHDRPRFKQIAPGHRNGEVYALDAGGYVWRWGDWYWRKPDGSIGETYAGTYWKRLTGYGDPPKPPPTPEEEAQKEVAELLGETRP